MNKSWLLGAALLLSLAGNAFLGGMLLGKPAHRPMMASMHPGADMPRLKHMMQGMRQLPEEQRQLVREKMHHYVPQLRELAERNRQEHQAIQKKMLLPELPRSELEADFARQRELQGQMQAMNQQMLLDIAGLLSPQQRAELLKTGPR
jgi:uncharacterized membrane protein